MLGGIWYWGGGCVIVFIVRVVAVRFRSFVRSVGGARFDTETSVTAQMIFLSNALFGTFYQAVNYYCDKR